jgi:hypothetical protein
MKALKLFRFLLAAFTLKVSAQNSFLFKSQDIQVPGQLCIGSTCVGEDQLKAVNVSF